MSFLSFSIFSFSSFSSPLILYRVSPLFPSLFPIPCLLSSTSLFYSSHSSDLLSSFSCLLFLFLFSFHHFLFHFSPFFLLQFSFSPHFLSFFILSFSFHPFLILFPLVPIFFPLFLVHLSLIPSFILFFPLVLSPLILSPIHSPTHVRHSSPFPSFFPLFPFSPTHPLSFFPVTLYSQLSLFPLVSPPFRSRLHPRLVNGTKSRFISLFPLRRVSSPVLIPLTTTPTHTLTDTHINAHVAIYPPLSTRR